jgi:hypothetical protein
MENKRFSDQIPAAVDASGMSRYAICAAIRLPQSSMSRFMAGDGGLSMNTLDRLGELLGLTATKPKRKRRGWIMASFRKIDKNWFYPYIDADGIQRERKGCSDRRETERMAAAEAGKIRAGYITPGQVASAKAEARTLADFHTNLKAQGKTAKYADLTRNRIGQVIHLAGTGRIWVSGPYENPGPLAAILGVENPIAADDRTAPDDAMARVVATVSGQVRVLLRIPWRMDPAHHFRTFHP